MAVQNQTLFSSFPTTRYAYHERKALLHIILAAILVFICEMEHHTAALRPVPGAVISSFGANQDPLAPCRSLAQRYMRKDYLGLTDTNG